MIAQSLYFVQYHDGKQEYIGWAGASIRYRLHQPNQPVLQPFTQKTRAHYALLFLGLRVILLDNLPKIIIRHRSEIGGNISPLPCPVRVIYPLPEV